MSTHPTDKWLPSRGLWIVSSSETHLPAVGQDISCSSDDSAEFLSGAVAGGGPGQHTRQPGQEYCIQKQLPELGNHLHQPFSRLFVRFFNRGDFLYLLFGKSFSLYLKKTSSRFKYYNILYSLATIHYDSFLLGMDFSHDHPTTLFQKTTKN